MKKNLIYGVITACIALILMVGAVMSAPDEMNDPTVESSTAVTTVPRSSDETTVPTHPQPTEETQVILPTETKPMEPATQPTEPTTQPTEPVTEPSQPETTEPTQNEVAGIRFVAWPESIAGGETGTVTIQGKPNTAYTIKVYYKSGPSGAKGLEDKISDADGFVSWTWKVSKNTKPGDFKIVVTGGGETAEVPFTVLD